VLAQAIANSWVILGQTALAQPSAPLAGDPLPQTGFGVKGPRAEPPLVTFPGLLRNIPELENAAAGRGLFTIRPERDGIVRRVPIVMRAEETIVPSLTLDLLRVVSGSGAILIKTDEAGVQSVGVRGLEIPTDAWGQLWIHFAPHDKSRFFSAKDLLAGNIEPDRFKGKLVLVGTSAVGLPRSQDDAGRSGHARRGGARAAPREHAEPHLADLAELRHPR
jgi:adenylate cyclase